jgi:hypothetical protein
MPRSPGSRGDPGEEIVGHHARTLLALCALLLISSLAWAAGASALTAKVRVETPSAPAGFIPRTIVTWDAAQPVKVSDTVSCPGNSPIGALNAATTNWTATASSTAPDTTQLASIKSAAITGTAQWATYLSTRYAANPCTSTVNDGDEVLFYPWCNGAARPACFTGGPLWMRFRGQNFFGTDVTNVAFNAPVTLFGIESPAPNASGIPGAPSIDSTLTTDEGFTARTDNYQQDGTGAVQFPTKGPHSVTLTEANKVPDRAAVCVSDGGDGLCGTAYSPPPDFDPNNYPSACDTNGHDGYCGTPDTSGPVATVTNIKQGQSFATKKGPGEVKGSLAPDPNGVGSVNIRIARTYTSRVRIKSKKKVKKGHKKPKVRYRTVRHCAVWSDKTALFESAKCTVKPKWAEATLDDTRENFSYDFALKLPKGSYKLEVQAKDVPGFADVVTPGRNVLTFTVK